MTKAKALLEFLSDFHKDYIFVSKVGTHPIGDLKLDDGVGIVDIELPLDDVDPDSYQVVIPLHFTYDDDYTPSIKIDIDNYLAADDGNPANLSEEGKQKVVDYLKANKAKMENDLEKFLVSEMEKQGDDRDIY